MRTLFDAPAESRPVVAGSLADRLPPRPYQAEALDGFRRHYAAGRRGMLYRLATGTGKAQPIDEPVLTPDGWKPIGDVRVGDEVIGADGTPTEVLAVYPQGVRPVYRVTFDDGCSTRACAEHLWAVRDKHAKRRGDAFKTLSTSEIAASLYRRWQVPTVRPVWFRTEPLLVDPYLLGVLIGDGSLTAVAGFSSADPFIVEEVKRTAPSSVRVVHRSKYDYTISAAPGCRNGLISALRSLGLYGKKADQKFIPAAYQRAIPVFRIALLQGLMDTDGWIESDGRSARFGTSSSQLADDVSELVRGLGGTVRRTLKQTSGLPCHLLSIRLPAEINPFALPRKRDAYRPEGKYSPTRIIDRVEPDGEAECVCIRVAAADRLYVTRDHVVTHNTYAAALTIEDWLAADAERRRVMVIAYERNLVQQFRDELLGFLPGVGVGLEMSKDGAVHPGFLPPVTVSCRASLQLDRTGRSRLYKFDAERFDWLIVCDEAHGWKHSMPSCRHVVDWFERNPASCFLGLTATPQRGDGVSLERLFGGVCRELRLSDAIADGYLVPLRQKFIVVEGVDFKNLHEVAGDFDEGELDQIVSEQGTILALVKPLLDHAGGRRTLVFCPGVASARAVARAINAEIEAKGLPHGRAESMDGSTPEDVRRATIGRHKSGRIQFLVVCGLCRAGYDDPGIGCVAVFRPTKSRVMAEQMKGRGVRPLRGLLNGLHAADERLAAIAASAKPDALVIDMVGVSGMPEVATTAHLFLAGEPDEVVERVNDRLADPDNDETIAEAAAKAKAEIAEEREAARRERLERERREAEEAKRRAKLRAEVRYAARDVTGPADAGTRSRPSAFGPPATDAQVRRLVAYGWNERAARGLSKQQAGGIIGREKAKERSGGMPARPTSYRPDPASPPTENQARVLEKFGRPVPATFADAADAIRGINRELAGAR